MDKRDEKIIELLMDNSRISFTTIAEELGISETAVRKRMKKLEESGIIKAYTLLVDPFLIGYDGVALVGIDTTPNKLLEVFEKIKHIKEVRYAALSSGDHMIVFEVWCKTKKELKSLLKDIERIDGITRVCPAILLKHVT